MITELPHPSDEDLATRALEDRAAFGLLYDRYAPEIYRFLRWRLNRDEDAWELVQDVFVKALTALERYDPGQSFRTWLYTIARRRLIDFWRTQKVTVDLDQVESIVERLSVDDQLDAQRAVEELLALLSDTERILVTLRYESDLSFKDIAQITGKSEGSLRTTFSRLKKVLNRAA
jgi:RNA polymerase sigma-70 factor (ECF subfamily)